MGSFEGKSFKGNRDRPGRRRIGCVLMLSLVSPVVWGQALMPEDQPLPPAARVLDHYIEVTGGRKAHAAIRTKVTKGHYKPPRSDQVLVQISYYAEPNSFYQETLGGPDGVRKEGVSGDVVWYINPQTGPAVREGIQRDQTLRFAAIHRDLNWRDLFKEAHCTGTQRINGVECYKVELTANNDDRETRYYAKKSGLLLATDFGADLLGGSVIRMSFYDYRKVGNLLEPHRTVQSFSGLEVEMIYESIRFNVDIPPSRFVLPREVLALDRRAPARRKP